MTAEIISVGTELLLGNILNTNAQYLSRELAALGITVQRAVSYTHLSLLVDCNKRRNHDIYQRWGFADGATIRFYGHEYQYMTKEV